jgi:hypothetical protein
MTICHSLRSTPTSGLRFTPIQVPAKVRYVGLLWETYGYLGWGSLCMPHGTPIQCVSRYSKYFLYNYFHRYRMLTDKYFPYRFDSVIASISVTITITLLFPLSLFNKKNLRNQLNQE